MTIDFFVHPEFPFDDRLEHQDKVARKRYLSHLIKILRQSTLPVLIKCASPGNIFDKAILPEFQFDSNSAYAPYRYMYEGALLEFPKTSLFSGDKERFANFLRDHKIESMRVHGSYFGWCTLDFASRLVNIFNRVSDNPEENGDYKRSGIKYGIVLHPPKCSPRQDILKPSEKLPYGNFNFQFIDFNTVIYGFPIRNAK